MPADPDSLLRVHVGALNGHDLESLAGHYMPQTRLLRDGLPVGEGPDALRALMEEYGAQDIVGRVMDVDGHPALVGWSGEGRGTVTSIVRLRSQGGRVTEVRIDHDADLIRRLADSAPHP
jgi:hypothetical protein